MNFKQVNYLQAFKMCYAQLDAYLLYYLLSSTQHACFDHYCLQNVAFETKFLRKLFKIHFGAQLSEPCNLTTCQIVFNNMVKSQIVDRKNRLLRMDRTQLTFKTNILGVPSEQIKTKTILSKQVKSKQDSLKVNFRAQNKQQPQVKKHLIFEQNLNNTHLLKQVNHYERFSSERTAFNNNKVKCTSIKQVLNKNKIRVNPFLPVRYEEKQNIFNSLKQAFSNRKNNVLAIAQLSNARLICGQWVLQYLIKQLIGKKSVKPILNNLLREASKFMRTKCCSSQLLGLKITLTGRLGARKKGMAQQLCRSVGRVPHGTLSQKVNFNQGFINTPLGTVGVKVWVCYA